MANLSVFRALDLITLSPAYVHGGYNHELLLTALFSWTVANGKVGKSNLKPERPKSSCKPPNWLSDSFNSENQLNIQEGGHFEY